MYLYSDEDFSYYQEKGKTVRVNFLTGKKEEVEQVSAQQLSDSLELRRQGL